MFVKFRNLRVNFDNVVNYWFQDKQEDWHIRGQIDIKHRYFLNIEYIGRDEPEHIEFQTKEEWESAKTILDTLIKPFDIYFEKE